MNAANASVSVTLGQPVTVALAAPEVVGWGPYQFPRLARLPDGRIEVSFHVEADSATAYGLPPARAVSADGGRTWTLLPREASTGAPSLADSVLLPNGDRLIAETLRSRTAAAPLTPEQQFADVIQCREPRPRSVPELQLPEKPFAVGITYGQPFAVYRLEDLPAACAAGWMLRRLPAGQTKWQEERATVQLAGETRVVVNGVMWFPWLFPQVLVAPDQNLWAVNYTIRRVVDGRLQEKYPTTVLRSTDAGRTWQLWSEIPYAPNSAVDPKAYQREGFTEPRVNFMPDGSALCLMRTTDGVGPGPLYQSRSTDLGKSWSLPRVFDELGVWPQLLTLENGITLAVYGRPGLYVRATADPSGARWDDRVTVIAPGAIQTETCSYAALLPLDDHTALMAYSDFNLRDAMGRKCKGICVRNVELRKGVAR